MREMIITLLILAVPLQREHAIGPCIVTLNYRHHCTLIMKYDYYAVLNALVIVAHHFWFDSYSWFVSQHDLMRLYCCLRLHLDTLLGHDSCLLFDTNMLLLNMFAQYITLDDVAQYIFYLVLLA